MFISRRMHKLNWLLLSLVGKYWRLRICAKTTKRLTRVRTAIRSRGRLVFIMKGALFKASSSDAISSRSP